MAAQLPLMLIPLILSISLASGALQFHSLTLSTLQNPTQISTSSLLSQPLTLDEDSINGPSLHLPIAHRDALFLPSNSTPEKTFLRRLSRDIFRASLIATYPNNSSSNATKPSFSSPVTSGLSRGSGEYFTRIGVGTPAIYSFMVLDTGSDIMWLQCAPCKNCYKQVDRIYDPHHSHSYSAVPCRSPVCGKLDSAGCDPSRRSCLYEVSYGDGSLTAGDLVTETLSFSNRAKVSGVALGCGHDNQGLFVAASGLLGLGRGPLSFPTQSGGKYGKKFSYCLVDRATSSDAQPILSSSAIFGDAAAPLNATWTPMVTNPKMPTFYYVSMTGISVGGTRVTNVDFSDLKLDPYSGKGGVILDSGTSVTRLAQPVYNAIRDAFKTSVNGLKQTAGGFSLFDTCYDLSGQRSVKVPSVSMFFEGGGEVDLPAKNYLIPVDTKGTFCFAFAGTENGVSIIGNIQQQGFRVLFDGDNQRIGFLAKGC